MNVLIIDDYESYGESLVELVQMLGHDAQYAPSFAEAEWLLDLLPFQVALLDFDMPAMTGPTIAANLVKRFPQIRPVIMSARPPDAERRAAIRDWTFVQKPLSREVLQDLFNDIVRQKAGFGLLRRGFFPILRVTTEKPEEGGRSQPDEGSPADEQ